MQETFNEHGFMGVGFDIKNAKQSEGGPGAWAQDMMNPWGFLTAVRFGTQMKKCGLSHVAICCSNLVYLCRSKTARAEQNDWWGNGAYERVRNSNCMIQRTFMLLCFLVCARVRWVLEQPGSSILRRIPLLQFIPTRWPDRSKQQEVHGHMGPYGAKTRKPTYWLGDAELMPTLKRPLRTADYEPTNLVTINETGGVTGRPDLVRDSERYAKGYGEHVFKEWHWVTQCMAGKELTPEFTFEDSDSDASLEEEEYACIRYSASTLEVWKFARLNELVDEANVPVDKLIVECI